MTRLNAAVLVGMLVCGLTLLAGFVTKNGSVEGLATYLGWFLCVYSALAYVIKCLGFALGKITFFWNSLYPVNFGLALLGVALYGIHDRTTAIAMGVLASITAGASMFISQNARLNSWLSVGVLIAPLLSLIGPVSAIWPYLFTFGGALLLARASRALISRGPPSAPQTI
jgi:hypothetical protein